jgi:hypothetical protein
MFIPMWLLVAVIAVVGIRFFPWKKITRSFKLYYYCWKMDEASKRGDAGAVVRWSFKAEDIGWNWEARKWNDKI